MNFQDRPDREQELQVREQVLRDRELTLRLRELEAELHARHHQTSASQAPEPHPPVQRLKTRMRRLIKWAKIIGCFSLGLTLVCAVAFGALIGLWVFFTVLLSTLVYLGYRLFQPTGS